MARDRVCGAIIRDESILMVRIADEDKEFWTLPGGGIEYNETQEEAVIREVKEEVNLDVRVKLKLFEMEYVHGMDYCFLCETINNEQPQLGHDPELLRSEGNTNEIRDAFFNRV
ncbi:NUDIX domain-containing protein [Paenibacillus eucommiae]|uniref:8-oxo-dGTP pyrophosphatase MutT (NUDIX family) n=1 Tax=Paenibacillus eucommiae TaxID=1355755 RepID=A0ABS4IQG4_9BACL|nr:NUDIX domain-containing protein [Paenibacillus eucommiae]MBP1989813.1 8-oxo-dGTP pyrophosphatase MutT (NUDIX family) [Paenibacillus eucommiae]